LFFLCLQVNLEGLLGGGDLGDVANQYISDVLPDLVEQNKGLYLSQVAELIKEKVNPYLAQRTQDDLLDLINNTPKKA
jgi:hypothetical protein